MINILLSGCYGHMGRVVASVAADDPDVSIIAGIDIAAPALLPPVSFPVFATPAEYADAVDAASTADAVDAADVIIDFSAPAALDSLLSYAISSKTPIVLCTTGYSPDDLSNIEKASQKVPVFRSGNMSLGINLLLDLVKRACTILGDAYDVEIVERHHRRKVDAPSGTALMLAAAAASGLPYTPEYVYERESYRRARNPGEIGISAVRGGTITGEHEVIFAGLDEVIEIKHSAASRDVFAVGAVKAAKFMAGVKSCGLYDMSGLLSEQ